MQQIPPNNLINRDTYYIESFGPGGSLMKSRGTATRINQNLFHFDNVIAYVNGQKIPSEDFYVPMNTHPNDPYHWRFYKPVAEDLMTKQVLRGLGVDKETSWGLHKHHINPDIGRGGKRKTHKRKTKKIDKKKTKKQTKKSKRKNRKTRSKKGGVKRMTKPKYYKEKNLSKNYGETVTDRTNRLIKILPTVYNNNAPSIYRAFRQYSDTQLRNMSPEEHEEIYGEWKSNNNKIRTNQRRAEKKKGIKKNEYRPGIPLYDKDEEFADYILDMLNEDEFKSKIKNIKTPEQSESESELKSISEVESESESESESKSESELKLESDLKFLDNMIMSMR